MSLDTGKWCSLGHGANGAECISLCICCFFTELEAWLWLVSNLMRINLATQHRDFSSVSINGEEADQSLAQTTTATRHNTSYLNVCFRLGTAWVSSWRGLKSTPCVHSSEFCAERPGSSSAKAGLLWDLIERSACSYTVAEVYICMFFNVLYIHFF